MKTGGKVLTIAGTVGSAVTFGLGAADMARLNAALDAKKREVGSDTLTSDEITEVMKGLSTVSSFGTGQFLTAEEEAGDGPLISGIEAVSAVLQADALKQKLDDAELARREAERKFNNSFTGGPPNMNMQTNNSSNITSYTNNNINTTDTNDLSNNSN